MIQPTQHARDRALERLSFEPTDEWWSAIVASCLSEVEQPGGLEHSERYAVLAQLGPGLALRVMVAISWESQRVTTLWVLDVEWNLAYEYVDELWRSVR